MTPFCEATISAVRPSILLASTSAPSSSSARTTSGRPFWEAVVALGLRDPTTFEALFARAIASLCETLSSEGDRRYVNNLAPDEAFILLSKPQMQHIAVRMVDSPIGPRDV
jgi:sarcosine oxidase gamma subunit